MIYTSFRCVLKKRHRLLKFDRIFLEARTCMSDLGESISTGTISPENFALVSKPRERKKKIQNMREKAHNMFS